MASSGAIKAGEAYVALGVDMGPLKRGLDAAAVKLKAFGLGVLQAGAGIAAIGGVVLAGFGAAVTLFADMGSDMLDMSQRTGVAVEALSELRYAAEQSGASAEDLEKGFKGMSEFLVKVNDGAPGVQSAMQRLNLSAGDLAGLTGDEAFEVFAERIAAIENPMERASVAADVFGSKVGGRLLPLMNDGAGGIRALREEARRLGISMSTEDATAAEALGDQFSSLTATLKATAFSIGGAVAPAVSQLMSLIIGGAAMVSNFVKENRELVQIVAGVAVGLVAIGGVLMVVGGLIYAAGYAITFLTGAFGMVAGVIGGGVNLALGALSIMLTVVKSGFGLLTLAQMAWAVGSMTWTAISTAAVLAYNAALAVSTFLYGIFTGASVIAQGATWGYTAALVAAWIWENICTLGVTLLITALGALVIAVGAVVLAFGGFIIAAALIAVIPAAIDKLSSAFKDLFGTIGESSWFGALSDRFSEVVGVAQTAFGGIKNAFSAGNWELIWDIAITGAELAWLHISDYAVGVFYTLKDTLVDALEGAWVGIKVSFISIWSEIKALAIEGVGTIAGAFVDGFNRVIDMINGMLNELPQSVRERLGIENIAQLQDPRGQFGAAARAERDEGDQQIEGIERDAAYAQTLRDQERADRMTSQGLDYASRTGELSGRLSDLANYAEMEAWFQNFGRVAASGAAPAGMGNIAEKKFSSTVAFGSSILGTVTGGSQVDRLVRVNEDQRRLLERIANGIEDQPEGQAAAFA